MSIIGHLTALHSKGYSVRATVTALTAAILIPLLLFGGWLVWLSAASEKAALERDAEREAREVTDTIDREMLNAKNVLTALVGSHSLQIGDLAGFHAQTSNVARQLNIQIVLRDPDIDMQLVNTARPFGTPLPQDLPRSRREVEEQALRSGQSAVSNVFLAPVLKQYFTAVVMPVHRDGAPAYFLSIGIPTKKFSDILHGTQFPTDWVVTIIDRDQVIVARSDRHDEFAGTRVLNQMPAETSAFAGAAKSVNREGIAYLWTWRRSAATGWFISVGIPERLLTIPVRRALANYGIPASLLFVVAMALSFHVGGRISQSMGALGVDRKPTREEFRVLFESAPNGVLVVDRDGLMVLTNARLERKFGYWTDELIGHPVEMLIPEHLRNGHVDLRKEFSRMPDARAMGAERVLFGRRKDGSQFPIEIGLNPIRTSAGNFVMATVIDITARKQSEARLSTVLAERDDLRRRYMQAQEDERLRLAHELHDQTGQSLAAVMLELKEMEKLVTAEGRDRLRMLRRQLEEMGKVLHRVAWELRPASIDELGLTSALAEYISEWSTKTGVDSDFHCRDTRLDKLADEIRTTIYRVVQEALTNVTKHAFGTTSVSVVVDRTENTLRLTIEDDGCGFDTMLSSEHGDDRASRRLGLAGMRERLALIGGDVEVESSAGAGTTIFVRVPLEKERLIA